MFYSILRLLALTLIVESILGCHSVNDRDELPVGMNCRLSEAPASSGEMASHGIEMRIFPRTKDMPANYSGCQTIWAYDHGSFVKTTQTSFVDGSAIELIDFTAEHSERPRVCRYTNGHAIGTNSACPTFDTANTRESSLPRGCLERLKTSELESNEPCFKDLN